MAEDEKDETTTAAAESAPEAAEAPATEPAEPVERLHPKEARKRARSAHTGKARASRTPEERQAERDERRAAKAKQRVAYRAKARAKVKADHAAHPAAEVPAAPERTGRPKVREGVVVSDKAEKTITVRIDTARRHRRYKKVIRSSTTLHAHDERNDAHEGDTVRVIECRPLSRSKRWRLVEVLERAK